MVGCNQGIHLYAGVMQGTLADMGVIGSPMSRNLCICKSTEIFMDYLEAFCFFDTLCFLTLSPILAWDHFSKKGVTLLQFFFYTFAIIASIFWFYVMFFSRPFGFQ